MHAAVPAGSAPPPRSPDGDRWLNLAAFATWLVVGTPTIVTIAGGELAFARAAAWTTMFVVFGAALAGCLRRPPIPRPRRAALIGVQTAAGLGMMAAGTSGTAGAVLVVVAAEAAGAFSARAAWLWAAVQTVGIGVVARQFAGWGDTLALAGAYAAFQGFAIAAMSLAISERSARERLSHANEELQATRSLLAEHSRAAERVRIARDLHDALGHHLTALSLQLDVASRLASGGAAAHVHEAHAITKLLLADVRDVVSRMRGTGRVDLAQALRSVTQGHALMRIHLDMPSTLPVDDPARAHALVRCAQEIATNAVRHGSAANLSIRIVKRADGIELHARDDGHGARDVTWGHGLTGMRERFAELSGSIEVVAGPDGGFEVHGFMPTAAETGV